MEPVNISKMMETYTLKKWNPAILEHDRPRFKNILAKLDQNLASKYEQLLENQKSLPLLATGVMGGISGELLYLFNSSLSNDNDALYDIAFKNVELLISRAALHSDTSFCSGLSGFVWFLYHLENKNIIPDAGSMIEDETIDFLYHKYIAFVRSGECDYMYGGLSIALPLIESRRKTSRHYEYLENIVEAMYKSATRNAKTVYWDCVIDAAGNKGVSFGLSHGLPGIVAILTKICQQGIAVDKCKELITEITTFILDKKDKKALHCLYPTRFAPDDLANLYPKRGRVAWCYGDINIAIALLYAYKVMKDETYKTEAEYILKYVIDHNEINEQYTHDGSFCHGAVGNGHLFNRLYNYTGNPLCQKTANYWFDKATQRVKYEDGVVKVKNVINDLAIWSDNSNVIMGTAGVGLTLISAISDISPPDWDDIFLLNI